VSETPWMDVVRGGRTGSRVHLSDNDSAIALLKPVALPRLFLSDGFNASVAACHLPELASPQCCRPPHNVGLLLHIDYISQGSFISFLPSGYHVLEFFCTLISECLVYEPLHVEEILDDAINVVHPADFLVFLVSRHYQINLRRVSY